MIEEVTNDKDDKSMDIKAQLCYGTEDYEYYGEYTTNVNLSLYESGKYVLYENPEIINDNKIIIVIDYPFLRLKNGIEFTCYLNDNNKKMTMKRIIKHIMKCYKKIYENPEKYGINEEDIYHRYEDLYLEGITYDNGKYKLSMSS